MLSVLELLAICGKCFRGSGSGVQGLGDLCALPATGPCELCDRGPFLDQELA